jgi:signal transduction histidine kinase
MAKVLIVDDEAGIRFSLGEYLKADGHAVWCAEAAPAALDILRQEAMDFVFCDINLPTMDGLALLRQMRSIVPGLQVIMMTGEPTIDNAAESLRNGAFDYLVKPVTEMAVHTVVAQAVRVKALEDERTRLEDENHRHREHLEQLVQERTQALQMLSAQLLRAQDDERRRLARELHDATGQKLSAAAMDLSILEKTAKKLPAKARHVLGEAQELIAQSAQELRTLSYLLHPPLLDEVGLAGAMREYARGFAARSGIAVELDLPVQSVRFRLDVEISIFRIVQECLANIHRHSGSAAAQVRLAWNNAEVRLQVSDQGRGRLPAKTMPDRAVEGASGVGISGMRERVRLLGGHLEVGFGPGGTIVEAVLPREALSALKHGLKHISSSAMAIAGKEVAGREPAL